MTYYDVLMVKNTATDEEIKVAYRNMLKAFHPDYYTGPKEFGERQTRLIVEAYSVLRDPNKKRAYDEWLKQKEQEKYAPKKENVGPKETKKEQASDNAGKKQQEERSQNANSAKTGEGKKKVQQKKSNAGINFIMFVLTIATMAYLVNIKSSQHKDTNHTMILDNTEYYLIVSSNFEVIEDGEVGSDWNFSYVVNGIETYNVSQEIKVEKGSEIRTTVQAIEEDAVYNDVARTSDIFIFDEAFFREIADGNEKVVETTLAVRENGTSNRKIAQVLATCSFRLVED